MGSEGHEHGDYEDEYAERDDNTRKPNEENESEHHNSVCTPAGVIYIGDLQRNLGLHHADLQQNSGVHHNEMHN